MLDCHCSSESFLCFFNQITDVKEAAVFIQSWLFFGLMSEVFGKKVREQDFVTVGKQVFKILTTQKFLTTQQWKSWGEEVISLAPEARAVRVQSIQHSLEIASKFTRLEDSGELSEICCLSALF